MTSETFWGSSPEEVRQYIQGVEYRRAQQDVEYAHYVHMLMNKMRQSRKDKAVKPDQIRRYRLPEEIPKEGISERQRRIQEERTGVVDLDERRRYLKDYEERYGHKKPKAIKGKGGE